jgi:lipoprotein-anchoring transpeptidase ErfK/SrfK
VCAVAGALLAVLLASPSRAASGTESSPTTTTTTTTDPARTIAEGVTVAGLDVGGLTGDAAFSIVRTAFEAPLVLTAAGSTLKPRPGGLGAVGYVRNAVNKALVAEPGTAIGLYVRVDGRKVRAYVADVAKRFDRDAVDSRVVLRNLRPFVTREQDGRALDRVGATSEIVRALQETERLPLALPFKRVVPVRTRTKFGPVIVIRRGSNRLFLYEGSRYRKYFRVATGQSRYPTPLGRYEIVVKWKNPWWYPPDSDWAKDAEPIPPGPGNPLGTRWMGLSAPSVGIHGTPDPASLGYSVSHGCIRMAIPDAEWMFGQVEIGTPVFIVRSE